MLTRRAMLLSAAVEGMGAAAPDAVLGLQGREGTCAHTLSLSLSSHPRIGIPSDAIMPQRAEPLSR